MSFRAPSKMITEEAEKAEQSLLELFEIKVGLPRVKYG
jgi:hypothetical protein